ncbi:MAG TPA: FAD-dependent monooxygenase [Amycolatopsis sp.]|uniref:FAD-dependent monooxygenase n=1 Tax=Amycolatopsis sp. TaxID=37632 RepID=UPI002B47F32E|nr:FAD-dependent monooxygenase [Amycolatopsis sp.]HKS46588.1 FAD-dependent monooxygenase [Amycolatopsis sp.]
MGGSVIVVGAGPVGLMLAGELRLGGVDVTVLERLEAPSGQSRGLGFTARATEVFDQRGLLARFGEIETSRRGHFGGIPMDFGVLEGSHFGTRGIPQDRTERILEAWALELGATILRGHELVDLRDEGDRVVAVAEGPGGRRTFSAAYLVGCDGGRSTVRTLAGCSFPGTEATREMYLADVVGRNIRPRFIGERVPAGMVMSAPLGDGIDRIIVCERGTPSRRDRAEPAFDVVADAWQRLTGESLHGAEARWVSVFTDATRQVTEYRRGRVLLAGDAAHVHLPAGGQGLSLGVQDAANLGWKLAATVRGGAPEGLLDTYHRERHPVGARVLRNTRAQGFLYLSGEEVEPLRSVMAELVAIPEVGRRLSGMVSGLDIRYEAGEHPLTGRRMPHLPLHTRDGQTSVARTLEPARGVLIDFTSGDLAGEAAGRAVDVVVAEPVPALPAGTDGVLLRPDGYVAWAGTDRAGLAAALRRWFGVPSSASFAVAGATDREG